MKCCKITSTKLLLGPCYFLKIHNNDKFFKLLSGQLLKLFVHKKCANIVTALRLSLLLMGFQSKKLIYWVKKPILIISSSNSINII